jgi:hypothetical protein
MCSAQVKPVISIIGGDEAPTLKNQIKNVLERVLLEANNVSEKTGDLEQVRSSFSPDAYDVFFRYITQNNAITARKDYRVQMIMRSRDSYDIRSITMRVTLGDTEASENQNLVFTCSREGKIIGIRTSLPTQDFHTMIAKGSKPEDSLKIARISEFLERFRMAYNSKDSSYLEQVYSDDALIIVGTVLRENKSKDYVAPQSTLSEEKVKLVQVSKREYIDGLKKNAFRRGAFLNVRFENVSIIQHDNPNLSFIYGVSCVQHWNAAKYSDRGYLFLMMDFRNPELPIIHVRTWQPRDFEDPPIGLYDFRIVAK